ncbi:unnamed protein product, partial [Mesorhabditis belari]|uniref:Uncharacterized protein n=1 Tax=Mesorhabditis belari TaxID=2138241 RepID=A0AAF3F9F1_9BILA
MRKKKRPKTKRVLEADDPKNAQSSLENTIVADTPLTQTTPPASAVASVVASTIPFFGAGSSPTSMTTSAELGELVSACRFAPNITGFESISVSIERIKKEIDKFETTQGFFDEFVNEVKDKSEKFH